MLLVVDIGNSHTVVGLYQKNTLKAHWRVKSDRDKTADEIAIQFYSLFSMSHLQIEDISGIILSSVVPSLEAAWVHCCTKHFSTKLQHPLFVVTDENLHDLISIQIDYPKEVGADRLVNGIAGWVRYKTDIIVIDFGTAITFDCVTKDCEYIGGTILPGLAISLEALSTKAAKLPHIDISTPPLSVIGKNTVQAMKSGILRGYGAMIDGLVEILGKEMGCTTGMINVIATGGMASLVIPYSKKVTTIDQMLTLKGLHHIFTCVNGNE